MEPKIFDNSFSCLTRTCFWVQFFFIKISWYFRISIKLQICKTLDLPAIETDQNIKKCWCKFVFIFILYKYPPILRVQVWGIREWCVDGYRCVGEKANNYHHRKYQYTVFSIFKVIHRLYRTENSKSVHLSVTLIYVAVCIYSMILKF